MVGAYVLFVRELCAFGHVEDRERFAHLVRFVGTRIVEREPVVKRAATRFEFARPGAPRRPR